MSKQIEIDARRIATESVLGSTQNAYAIWNDVIKNLKLWEVHALRDLIRKNVQELDAAKSLLQYQKDEC